MDLMQSQVDQALRETALQFKFKNKQNKLYSKGDGKHQ